MNPLELYEAYSAVYAPQEVDEEQLDEISQKTATKAYALGTSDEFEGIDDPKSVARNTRLRGRIEKKFGKKAAQHADRAAHSQTFGRKGAGGMPPVKEEFDVFDVVLEFLYVEGYAETLEEAEWMMANIIDEEAIAIVLGEEELDEAEGSYGQTPKATASYAALAKSRSGSGKKVASKHAQRSQKPTPGHSGKRSSSPYHTSGDREKMTQKDRDYARGRDEYGHTGYDSDYDGPASGPGGKPKGKKLERQKKTGVSAESFDYVDESQHARENPEKYEREQAKKSAPVRGERTPMPPRGDKRREDFEKWYAKNVR
jgi:hypothetical protein